jgi:hypothetical protein
LPLCRGKALGKGPKALGKGFAEGGSWQKTLGKFLDGKGGLCRGPFIGHSAKKSSRHGAGTVGGFFAEGRPSAKIFFIFLKKRLPRVSPRQRFFIFYFLKKPLLRASSLALGKVMFRNFLKKIFAEGYC